MDVDGVGLGIGINDWLLLGMEVDGGVGMRVSEWLG